MCVNAYGSVLSSMQAVILSPYMQVVRRYWERNDVKNSISSIEKMADNAVSNFGLFTI